MRRPNVLIILTDDQGWGDLSVHGNTNLKTPNVDSLARDGAIFDRFYVCEQGGRKSGQAEQGERLSIAAEGGSKK